MGVDINDVGAYKVAYADTLHNTVLHRTTCLVYHHTGNMPEDAQGLRALRKIPFGPQLWNSPCWVSCDCEYFMYHCEVALHRFNASDIVYSDGSFPEITNPRMVPMLCKHLYALAPVLIQMRRQPTGRDIPKSKRPVHPPHRGRLPKHIVEHLDRHTLVPTADEVDIGMTNVRDFL